MSKPLWKLWSFWPIASVNGKNRSYCVSGSHPKLALLKEKEHLRSALALTVCVRNSRFKHTPLRYCFRAERRPSSLKSIIVCLGCVPHLRVILAA